MISIRAAFGAAVLAAASVMATTGTPASAQSASCVVEYDAYSVSATQFYAAISVGSLGLDISGWTLRYSYAGNQSHPSATQGGTWSQSGQNVTVTSTGDIAPWHTARAAALFTFSGANSAPAAFTVNGAPCGIAFGCAEVGSFGSMVAPVQGEVFARGSAITVSANAYGGCPVRAVTFFATNTTTNTVITIGTVVVTGSTRLPYTLSWENAPPGSYLLHAEGYAPPGGTAYTPSVSITVTP
jgi:hypothetical protein